MNSIVKYIDWGSIWTNEVNVSEEIEFLEGDEKIVARNFLKDKDVELDISECEIREDNLIFVFSEQGGQNESDTQGWSREYCFCIVPQADFGIRYCNYEQG